MKSGRPPLFQLCLSDEERCELERKSRQTRDRQLSFRCRIILRLATGLSGAAVARELKTTGFTIGFWKKRYFEEGLAGLQDRSRSGAPRRVSDAEIAAVLTRTIEMKPKGSTHWSTRSMAKLAAMSPSTIGRMWRAFGLKPHVTKNYQLSTDPDFIEKVRDVVGLYMSPPTNALVLCVDEKSQIQALNRTQPIVPATIAHRELRTPEYKRNGVTSLFAALDVATGNVIGKCYPRHRSLEFLKFLEHISQNTSPELDLHLVLDNYATHKTREVHHWLLAHPRFHLHFIPTHSSWLNQIERWFAILTEKQIRRGSHHSVAQLEEAIHEFIDAHNELPKPFTWKKTADHILEKVARFARNLNHNYE